MSEKQTTLLNEVILEGIGLHTGVNVTMKFKPAPADHGYVFKRVDMEGQPEIPALAEFVTDTSRGTTLSYNGAIVATVEHALAALVGLEIDNVLIEMNHEESPILDGSSRFFIEALEKGGVKQLDAERDYFVVEDVISFVDEERQTELTIIPDDSRRINVMIDYNTKVLGTQNAELNDFSKFKEEISMCRTFVFLHELEFLLDNNLIKGGDLSNAIVFVNKVVGQEELDRLAKLFNKPTVEVLQKGILNNVELHFFNEPARHKLLDVMGDMALIGKPIKGRVIALRPGHSANIAFSKLIRKKMKQLENNAPKIDLNSEPQYDINAVKRMLPHRPPFLLVDKIMKVTKDTVIGVKNVTMNEAFFVGHFPDEPVMPAVLQIEAMAQSGGILVLSQVEHPEEYVTYFLKIDNVRLRNKVVPGDTIVFDLKLMSPIRRGLCHMGGKAWVGNKVVMEADMLAQIVKKKN